jgi:hypothetical protein
MTSLDQITIISAFFGPLSHPSITSNQGSAPVAPIISSIYYTAFLATLYGHIYTIGKLQLPTI